MPSSEIILERPNRGSIQIGGKYINQSALSRAEKIDPSYLSKMFAGKSTPTVDVGTRIAHRLGMTFQDFLNALEDRNGFLRVRKPRRRNGHVTVTPNSN